MKKKRRRKGFIIGGCNDYEALSVDIERKVRALVDAGYYSNESEVIKNAVIIMNLAYKENVPDTRESPVREMVKELKEFGVNVYGYDPLLSKEEIEAFGVKALDFSFSTGFLL